MKTVDQNPDVLVVGGGLAGCALAVSLHRKGLHVLLVEREKEARESYRGEYIQPYAVKALGRLGFDEISQDTEITRIKELRFRDLDADGKTILSETLVKYPEGSFAAVMSHRQIVSRVRRHASSVLGPGFLLGATLSPLNREAPGFKSAPRFSIKTENGETVVAPKWVVGCDGRNSSVRKWIKGADAPVLGNAVLGAFPQFIVGCEIQSQLLNASRYDVIRTRQNGTLAIFELHPNSEGANNRLYWNAPAVREKSNREISQKDSWKGELNQILARCKPMERALTGDLERIAGATCASKWLGATAKGRFFLAGDAAGITTPLGGQGMNYALRHVEILTGLLEKDSDRSIFSRMRLRLRYTLACFKAWSHIFLLNMGLYYLFFARPSIFRVTTRHVMETWNRKPHLSARVGRLFGGDDLDTPGLFEILQLWGVLPSASSTTSNVAAKAIIGK